MEGPQHSHKLVTRVLASQDLEETKQVRAMELLVVKMVVPLTLARAPTPPGKNTEPQADLKETRCCPVTTTSAARTVGRVNSTLRPCSLFQVSQISSLQSLENPNTMSTSHN